ncbi:hypothetical protein IPQ38_22185 [Xanthomonas perforans]|nr:hypothetical protein [Xanthomonas perforans]
MRLHDLEDHDTEDNFLTGDHDRVITAIRDLAYELTHVAVDVAPELANPLFDGLKAALAEHSVSEIDSTEVIDGGSGDEIVGIGEGNRWGKFLVGKAYA